MEEVRPKRICLYARISKSLDQNPENQYEPLLTWFAGTKYEQIKDPSMPNGIFVDEVSSKDLRPKKEQVLRKIRLGEADGVCFAWLDRWGRSMGELVLEMEEFANTGKSMISLKEGIDLSTSAGRLMANVLAAMANFERDRIRERTMLGIEFARTKGKATGRHPVNCGCGYRSEDGKVKHNGNVKPVRNEHNRLVAWLYPDGRKVPVRRFETKVNSQPVQIQEETPVLDNRPLETSTNSIPNDNVDNKQVITGDIVG